jgi:hypothetical protein
MKKFHPFYLISFLLIFLFSTFSANAQDEPKNQLFWVHEEKAKINMLDQYEKTSKEILNMFKEGGLNVEINVSQQDDNLFYYLIPISKYADIDSIYKNFNSASEKVGKDKWSNEMVENSAAIEFSKDAVVSHSGKYSYMPKTPRIKPDEVKFIHFDYFYVIPEKRKEFFDLARQYKELNEKNNIDLGYNVWIPEFGFDNDLVVVTTDAKGAVDFYQTNDMVNEKLGKDGDMLWNKMIKTLKNFTHINGHPRYDLSMMKEEK